MNLTWTDKTTSETGFTVKRSPDGAAVTFVRIATVAADVVSYSDTGLLGGTTYYYGIRATSAAGNSAYSNIASAKTPSVDTKGPAAPTLLIAFASSNRDIIPGWNHKAANETGFTIERAQNGLTFIQIATVGGNVRIYPDTDLSAGTTYYYRVRSTNAAGDSAFSNTVRATTFSRGQ